MSTPNQSCFYVVHLKVTKASYDKLVSIGSAKHLREYVKVLTYDGRLLLWNLRYYHEWEQLLHSAPGWTAVDLEGNPVACKDVYPSIKSTFSKDELHQYWDEYCMLLEDQKALHRGEQETEDLVQIFTSFPKLASFYLDTGLWMGLTEIPLSYTGACLQKSYSDRRCSGKATLEKRQMLVDAFTHLSTVGQCCLIEPGFIDNAKDMEAMKPAKHTFGVKRLLALIEASRRAERQITFLSVAWLDLHHVLQKIECPAADDVSSLRDFLGHLTHLTIRFGDWGCSLESWNHAASLIGLAKNITFLEVEGKSEDTHLKDRQTRMSALFERRFSKLVKLVIRGLWVDLEMFQIFVNAHQNCKSSLRPNVSAERCES